MDGNVVAAFSADQVVKLTGLTMRQLAYWDRTGFFRPHYASTNRRSPYSRIYSFPDVVGLRTISLLKNVHGVTMAHLKRTAERLSKFTERPWSDIKLSVWNREVVWIDPETGRPETVLGGQGILFKVLDVIEDMKQKTRAFRVRGRDDFGKVVANKNVVRNRPVIAGTRISVDAIKRLAKDGFSAERIVEEYPSLTLADVDAALKYQGGKHAA
jgi:uncharacterized protein (DUF433 family)/DNA-binding transcriptional MerR regulator